MASLDHLHLLLPGLRGDILAGNALLASVFGRDLEPGTSFLRYHFQDPLSRERIVNWEMFAAALRRESGRRPYDRRLTALIEELRRTYEDVARWWDDHGVLDYSSVSKRIDHPTAGPLIFDIETVATPYEPEQHLVIYTVHQDSPTARVLPLLASWDTDTADNPAPRGHRGRT